MHIISSLSICLLTVINGFSQSDISINSMIGHLNDFPLQFRSFATKELHFKFKDTRNFEGGLIAEDKFEASDSMMMTKGYFASTIIAAKGKGLEPVFYIRGTKNYLQRSYDVISKYINNPKPPFNENDIWESIKISNISKEIGEKIIDELALLGAIEVIPCGIETGPDFRTKYFCSNQSFRISMKIPKGEKTTYGLLIYKSTDQASIK